MCVRERKRETHRCRMWGMIASELCFLDLKSHASLEHTSSIWSVLFQNPTIKAYEQSKNPYLQRQKKKKESKFQKQERNPEKEAEMVWMKTNLTSYSLPCECFSMVDWSEVLLVAKEALNCFRKQWE